MNGQVTKEELLDALENLVNTLEDIEDLEHNYFGCLDESCPLCYARHLIQREHESNVTSNASSNVKDNGFVLCSEA